MSRWRATVMVTVYVDADSEQEAAQRAVTLVGADPESAAVLAAPVRQAE